MDRYSHLAVLVGLSAATFQLMTGTNGDGFI